jgi:hypothetical protein
MKNILGYLHDELTSAAIFSVVFKHLYCNFEDKKFVRVLKTGLW